MFWHRHGRRCEYTRWPKSKLEFWRPKLERNHLRDKHVRKELRKLGWQVLVVWECQLKNTNALAGRLRAFLEDRSRSVELFTGAGGLALGIERAGFHHDTVVERDKDCCQTILRTNVMVTRYLRAGACIQAIVQIRLLRDPGRGRPLGGGPPCQPFSIGGNHKGPLDSVTCSRRWCAQFASSNPSVHGRKR